MTRYGEFFDTWLCMERIDGTVVGGGGARGVVYSKGDMVE